MRNAHVIARSGLIRLSVRPSCQVKSDYESGVPSEQVPLKDFIESACIVVKGQIVARCVLIKYVANKLGGAHHDHRAATARTDNRGNPVGALGNALSLSRSVP